MRYIISLRINEPEQSKRDRDLALGCFTDLRVFSGGGSDQVNWSNKDHVAEVYQQSVCNLFSMICMLLDLQPVMVEADDDPYPNEWPPKLEHTGSYLIDNKDLINKIKDIMSNASSCGWELPIHLEKFD